MAGIFPVSAGAWGLTKTDSPDPVAPGDTITYTLNWQEVYPGSDQYYVTANLTEYLDQNLELVSASGSYLTDGNMIIWDLGMVGPLESGTHTLIARVKPGTPDGTVIHNAAMVFGYDGAGMDEWLWAYADTTVRTTHTTPKFPPVFLPAAMIIGMLGFVLLIQRAGKH